jgi:hypothetical protein
MNADNATALPPRRPTERRVDPLRPRLTHLIRTASLGLYAIYEPRPESFVLHNRRRVPGVEAAAAR